MTEHIAAGLDELSEAPNRLVLAYSGGADSTALLVALLALSERATLELVIAHVDHRLDSDSTRRAQEAKRLALSLLKHPERPAGPTVLYVTLRSKDQAPQASISNAKDYGVEANARNQRYELLEQCREQHRADLVLTAHHANDQLETVLLRLGQGSGLFGLSSINKQRGSLWRPLLRTHRDRGPTASDLRSILIQRSTPWLEDPTNQDRRFQRNRARHDLLPLLLTQKDASVEAPAQADRLAATALRVRRSVDQQLSVRLGFQADRDCVSLDFDRFLQAGAAVRNLALDSLHRSMGLHYPPSQAAKNELHRQIVAHAQPSRGPRRSTNTSRDFGCSCGNGWCWRVRTQTHLEGARSLLILARSGHSEKPRHLPFAYTLSIPGTTLVPEASSGLEASRARAEPWMTRRWHHRAALFVPNLQANLTVRNRRAGDTVYAFGGGSQRIKLKKLLIDRKIPQNQRHAVPIVCVDEEIAWIAGVTIAEPFRIPSTTIAADQSIVTLRLQRLPEPATKKPPSFNAS